MSLLDCWYVLCRSSALSGAPLATLLHGNPVVLFRALDGRSVALLDRCPHRNVPLSLGSVRGDALECRYHGWRVDRGGACAGVPGRCSIAAPKARVPAFATVEQDGYVWAWGRADASPGDAPYRLEPLDGRYTVLHATADYPAGLHASLENTIDVPHTVFLHRGLFRTEASQHRVQCTVSRSAREVRARYQGESRPDTWLARLLAPGGGVLEHEDSFLLPSIVRVEYRLGPVAHLMSNAFFTPLDGSRTRLHVQIAYRLGVPGAWLAPLLKRVTARVLREDVDILRAQTENVARFGGPSFASTELDVFSVQIQQLLDDAEAGTIGDKHSEQTFELMM